MSANERQVAGSHYHAKGKKIQHWDLAVMFQWDPFQYQITKYVMRWKDKHSTPEKRLEDLKKAQHFLEKYIEEAAAYDPTSTPVEQPAQLPPGVEYDLSPSFVVEGYSGDGTALYTCKDCNTRFWGTQQDAIAHLVTHWDK